MRLIDPRHGASLGWAPVPGLWARGETVVWQSRRLGADGRRQGRDELRRWTPGTGVETLAALDGDVDDVWIEGDLVLWIAPGEVRRSRESCLFASVGLRPLSVASPDDP